MLDVFRTSDHAGQIFISHRQIADGSRPIVICNATPRDTLPSIRRHTKTNSWETDYFTWCEKNAFEVFRTRDDGKAAWFGSRPTSQVIRRYFAECHYCSRHCWIHNAENRLRPILSNLSYEVTRAVSRGPPMTWFMIISNLDKLCALRLRYRRPIDLSDDSSSVLAVD